MWHYLISGNPFINDLRRLEKPPMEQETLRDEQLSIADAGEKVRKLIEDHIYSTGVDPKIPPVDLLASDFQEKLDEHKNTKTKASEIENAIKHHIKIKLDDDPEYYKSLSEKLESIIRKHEEKWDDLVQLLLEFRDTIEAEREVRAEKLGLSETEFAFHGILLAEIKKGQGVELLDTETSQKETVVKQLVLMMDEATQIVGFFQKWDEQKGFEEISKEQFYEFEKRN